MRATTQLLALGVLSVALAPLACGGGTPVASYLPATARPVPGSPGLKQVTFTAEAARRAGVETSMVRRVGGQLAVPYAALIYNEKGETFTYLSPRPLLYVRQPIHVVRITGNQVFLNRGPAVGSVVVTTGAAEILSAESEVSE